MLTPEQEKLYINYMEVVSDLQNKAFDLTQESYDWTFPDGSWKISDSFVQSELDEIMNTLDIAELAARCEKLEKFNNDQMMAKLSENIAVDT